MEFCPECGTTNLSESNEYIECEECGSKFELGSEDNDYEEYDDEE